MILTSLFGYLEWGHSNRSFLYQIEYLVITQLFTNITSVIHPFVLLPLLGQLLLLITLFTRSPGKVLTYIGIACLTLLLGLMFIIGIMGMNWKIIVSTLPFILTALAVILNNRKIQIDNNQSGT